jgi:hypothetical protein
MMSTPRRGRRGCCGGAAAFSIPGPLFDAVATQDTVIQLRAAIRKVLAAADRVNPQLATAVRATLTRDDDYATLGKPPCDWDDPKAREALVDALVRDAQAAVTALEGHELDGPRRRAAGVGGRRGRPARKPVADGSSASTPTKPPYNTPKPARKTPSGSRPTAPIAPSWNARSATSPTAPGAAEKPAAADKPAS